MSSPGAMHIYKQQQQRRAEALARSRQRWAQEESAQKLENFCDAAKDGNLTRVKSLLNDVDIDKGCKAYKGKPTALFLAAQAGKTDVVRFLLEQGASVDKAEETQDKTPLWDAAHNNHFETVKALVEYKANLEIKDYSYKKTPLAIAASRGNAQIVTYLIQKGANKEAKTHMGNTPLINAIFAGRLQAVVALLQGGVNPTQTGNGGFSPLYLAAQENQVSIARLLLKHKVNVHFGNESSSNSPLSMAACEGHIEMAELLLEYGAEINPKSGIIPINTAINNDREAMVRFLVQNGATLNPKNLTVRERSPLMHAAYNGKVKMMEVLLDIGAEIDLMNSGQFAALYYATIGNQPAAVTLLISKGATLKYEVPAKQPLFKAIDCDFPEIVKALHDAGADIHQPFKMLQPGERPGVYEHDTPLNMALTFKKVKSAAMLFELGAMPTQSPTGCPLSHVLINKQTVLESLRLLVEKQPECVNDSYQSKSLLHVAVQNAKDAYVSLLITHHANANPTDENGQTPLHLAAKLGHAEILTILIGSQNIIVDPVDLEGRTPLQLAALFGHFECLQLLMDNRADIYFKSVQNKGEDIMWILCVRGDLKAVHFLLDRGFDLQVNQETYAQLSKDSTFKEEESQTRKAGMKLAAIDLVLDALTTYESLEKSKDSSREGLVSQLKEKLEGFKSAQEKETADVLQAVEGTISEMTAKKLYGWRGLKKSKLYQGLDGAKMQITALDDILRRVLGEK